MHLGILNDWPILVFLFITKQTKNGGKKTPHSKETKSQQTDRITVSWAGDEELHERGLEEESTDRC